MSSARRGALTGLGAGWLAFGVQMGLRAGVDAPTLQEALEAPLTAGTPPALFALLLERLEYLGKPLLFGGLTLALLALGSGLGALWGRLAERPALAPGPLRGALLGLGLALLQALLLFSLGPTATAGAEPLGLALLLLLPPLTYGLTLGTALRRREGPEAPEPSPQRRAMLAWLGGVALATLLGTWGVSRLLEGTLRATASRSARRPPAQLPPEITPQDRFYVVSKNLRDPVIRAEAWRLTVDGEVERPLTLTYEDLRALPAVEEMVTLECISNEVGGDLISNARWRGVRLQDLLERAGVKPTARRIAFFSEDGYSESLPLEDALRPEVMVVYEMNGEPLSPAHGFPARLLVPGRYGMKSPKWLTRITARTDDFLGFWEVRGWSDSAIVKTMSQVLLPLPGSYLPQERTLVGGIAFAGSRGLRAVEVSDDAGQTWHRAVLRPALSRYAWVLWTLDWTPPRKGRILLQVRAIDGTGAVQPAEAKQPFPDGAEGHHRILVLVDWEPPSRQEG